MATTHCVNDGVVVSVGYLFIAWGYDGCSRRQCLAQLIARLHQRLGWALAAMTRDMRYPQTASGWWPPARPPQDAALVSLLAQHEEHSRFYRSKTLKGKHYIFHLFYDSFIGLPCGML